MIALLGIVTVLLEYIDRLIPIMPALCSMLLVTYYAFNYAGIIGRGLVEKHQERTKAAHDGKQPQMKFQKRRRCWYGITMVTLKGYQDHCKTETSSDIFGEGRI